jgi:hypothetical protein
MALVWCVWQKHRVLLHQSGALFIGRLARNREESAFMMWPDNHPRLSSTSPGHAFIGSLHKRMQAEYSPAIRQIGSSIDSS